MSVIVQEHVYPTRAGHRPAAGTAPKLSGIAEKEEYQLGTLVRVNPSSRVILSRLDAVMYPQHGPTSCDRRLHPLTGKRVAAKLPKHQLSIGGSADPASELAHKQSLDTMQAIVHA